MVVKIGVSVCPARSLSARATHRVEMKIVPMNERNFGYKHHEASNEACSMMIKDGS
jgi:hypothetical protein